MKSRTCLNQSALTFLLILSFHFSSLSQVKYEEGYFINNENVKTSCLIKNMDWHYNPLSFEYKLSETGQTESASIQGVKEFGVTGYSTYVRANVRIDRSKDLISDPEELSDSSGPQWSTERLFLKLVHNGAARLYSYEERNLERYFYAAGSDEIEQLVYKAYKRGQNNVAYNNTYLSQLSDKMNCGQQTEEQLNKTDCTERSLTKYFLAYDACKGIQKAPAATVKKRKSFAVSLLGGFSYASLATQNSTGYDPYSNTVYFSGQWNPVIGAELEYFLPFGAGKWSIPLQIYNRNYNASHTDSIGNSEVKYNAIELGVGARYRAFINENLSVFLNALVILDFKTDCSYQGIAPPWLPQLKNVEISTAAPIFAGGAGLEYKRISAEFRYFSTRDLFVYANNWGSAFKSYSVLVKFRLFKF